MLVDPQNFVPMNLTKDDNSHTHTQKQNMKFNDYSVSIISVFQSQYQKSFNMLC